MFKIRLKSGVWPLLYSFVCLSVAHPARAEDTDFGKAQKYKNSYEAQQESRERNNRSIQLEQVPTGNVYDNSPRSSSEINAEQQRKMDEIDEYWARVEEERAREREEKNQKEQEKQQEENRRIVELSKRINDKARSIAFKSDEKWDYFYRSLSEKEKRMLRAGAYSFWYFHSPMADMAKRYLIGEYKEEGMDGEQAARVILKRCMAIQDGWCFHDLGKLEAATHTPETEQIAFQLYTDGLAAEQKYEDAVQASYKRPSIPAQSSAAYALRIRLAFAYANGRGTQQDRDKAGAIYRKFVEEKQYEQYGRFNPESWSRYEPWQDGIILGAEFLKNGIGTKVDVEATRSLLRRALIKTDRNSWRLLERLINTGADLDDLAKSYNILKDAYDRGRTQYGAEVAMRLMKGKGVSPDPDKAYEIAMSQPKMKETTVVKFATMLMGNDGVPRDPKKAVALLERFGKPENVEHAKLLVEARAALANGAEAASQPVAASVIGEAAK